jgi:large subunit ribosomal protein L29
MELSKLRTQTDEELKATQLTAAEQLFRIRFQKSLGSLEGIKQIKPLKLDIARAKTIARERTLAAEKAAHPAVVRTAPAPSQRTARKKAKV